MKDRIEQILQEQGQTVTYRRVTGITRNETTLQNTQTTTDYTVKAHFRNFTDRELSGLVQENDRQVRIAKNSLSFTPASDDKIIVSGETYNIVNVDARTADGELAMYIMKVRGVSGP